MAQEIKFGTDGWRGVIADDFTFENVRRVAGAIASYVLKYEEAQRGVCIGYDTRFISGRAAQIVAEVIAAAGIPVRLANDYTPTPAVSYAVKTLGAAGGVMVTSSHNPWNWNGVKFKGKFGGSATPAIMKKIEEEMALGAAPKGKAARVEEVDFKPAYVAAVCGFADMDLIAKTKFKFAVDAMYGSGRGVLPGIFAENGVQHIAIRQEVNPLFPGINPEPIEPHTAMLQETVVREKCDAGLATDGDADRIGAAAEDGSFVDSHKIFCVLLRWLLERKKWPGDVVRAFNTTRMLDRIAAKYGRKLHETSIGFKYVADLMMEHEILIGGEESGGIGYSRFLARARWRAEFPASGQCDGGRRQTVGSVGSGFAARVWSALLRAARSANSGRRQTERDPTRARGQHAEAGTISRDQEGEPRRREILSGCSYGRERSGGVDFVSRVGDRATASALQRGCVSGFGPRDFGEW